YKRYQEIGGKRRDEYSFFDGKYVCRIVLVNLAYGSSLKSRLITENSCRFSIVGENKKALESSTHSVQEYHLRNLNHVILLTINDNNNNTHDQTWTHSLKLQSIKLLLLLFFP